MQPSFPSSLFYFIVPEKAETNLLGKVLRNESPLAMQIINKTKG